VLRFAFGLTVGFLVGACVLVGLATLHRFGD
jgi:hypothetical protein